MSTKMKKKMARVGLRSLAVVGTLLGGTLAALLSIPHAMMNIAFAEAQVHSNWIGIISTMTFVGLGVCFILAQLLLVRRNVRSRVR